MYCYQLLCVKHCNFRAYRVKHLKWLYHGKRKNLTKRAQKGRTQKDPRNFPGSLYVCSILFRKEVIPVAHPLSDLNYLFDN